MKLSSLFAFSDFKVLESVFRRRNKGIRTPNGVNPNRGSEILSVRNPPQEHELKEDGTRSHTGGILSVRSQPSSSSSRSSSACGRGGFQVFEICSKHSSTASMLGRLFASAAQHRFTIFHKSSREPQPWRPFRPFWAITLNDLPHNDNVYRRRKGCFTAKHFIDNHPQCITI